MGVRSLGPRALHAANGAGGAFMRSRQPLPKLAGRVGGRRTIEGHQRGRHPGCLDDAGTPTSGVHSRDLNEVGAASDRLFEALDGIVHRETVDGFVFGGRVELYASWSVDQAKRRTKLEFAAWLRANCLSATRRNISCCRTIHRKFTLRPQLFNTLTHDRPARTLDPS